MENKKGVSDVVTTVLIILLVIVAVGVLAGYLLNTVKKAGPQVEQASSCVELSLTPVSCTAATGAVKVKWEAGAVKPSKVKLVYTNASGATSVVDATGTLPATLLETATVTGTPATGFGTPSNVKVAGVVSAAGADDKVCPESVSIACS